MIAPAEVGLTLPALPASLAIVRQVLAGMGDALGWDEAFLADVKLAVSEACANVVVHAYGTEIGEIDVHAVITDDQLVTSVRDSGGGITPTIGGDDGGGVGLALMVSVADLVAIRSGRGSGTAIELSFTIPSAQPITP